MPLALRFPAALVRRRTARPEGCQQDRPIADDGATGLPTGERALDLSEQDSVGCSPLSAALDCRGIGRMLRREGQRRPATRPRLLRG